MKPRHAELTVSRARRTPGGGSGGGGRAVLLALLTLAAIPAGLRASRAEAETFYCILAPFEDGGPCAVASFDVTAEGALVQGASYPTGGFGRAMTSTQDLQIDASGEWLLASNNISNDVSVFAMAADGSLTAAPGSPYPAGGTPTRIAVHPSLPLIYVALIGAGTIGSFTIRPDGSLSAMGPIKMVGFPGGIAVEPRGKSLYAAAFSNGVEGFEISETGTLSPLNLPASPLVSSRAVELEIDPVTSQLILLDLDNGIAAFNLGVSGKLDLVPGSPVSVGAFSHSLALSGDGRFVYVGLPFNEEIPGFELAPAALPRPILGSPFKGPTAVTKLCSPRKSSRLHAVTRESRSIETYLIAENGSLSAVPQSAIVVDDPMSRVPNGAVHRARSALDGFRRGDSNADGAVNLADALFTLNHLFQGSETPPCPDAADADDSGSLDLADAVVILGHLFQGRGPIVAPGSGSCGSDPTEDTLATCGNPGGACAR